MSFFKAFATKIRQAFSHAKPAQQSDPIANEMFEILSREEIENADFAIRSQEAEERLREDNLMFSGLQCGWILVSITLEEVSLDKMETNTLTSFMDKQFDEDPCSVL